MFEYDANGLTDAIFNEKSNSLIDYHKYLTQLIYYNDNYVIRKNSWTKHKKEQSIKYNIHGYRSPEFTKNVDFLFSGCSVTFGNGLDSSSLWYERLIKDVGGSYSCLAKPGDGVVEQVLKIFAYIKEFGNPKNLICLFPDFNRFLSISNKNLFVTKHFLDTYDEKIFNMEIAKNSSEPESSNLSYFDFTFKSNAFIEGHQEEKRYFKRPLIMDEVINQETSHFYSAQYINILSQYCEIAGINFIWGTWDNELEVLINKIKNESYFKEHIDVDASNWIYNYKTNKDLYFEDKDLTNQLECHLEFNNEETFHLANDRQDGIKKAHFGYHRHIHYYEKFLEKISLQK
jgi:hypothetical protein